MARSWDEIREGALDLVNAPSWEEGKGSSERLPQTEKKIMEVEVHG